MPGVLSEPTPPTPLLGGSGLLEAGAMNDPGGAGGLGFGNFGGEFSLHRRPRRRRLRRALPAPTHLSGCTLVARQNCVTPYNRCNALAKIKLTRRKVSSNPS